MKNNKPREKCTMKRRLNKWQSLEARKRRNRSKYRVFLCREECAAAAALKVGCCENALYNVYEHVHMHTKSA